MIALPRHLSVSSVSLFARCAEQWRLRYVEKLVTPTTAPQAWGKAFHAALEALHRGQDAELAWLAAWNAASANFAAAGQSFGPGKQHGLELLDLYRRLGFDGVKGEPERKFVLPFPGGQIPVPLLGYIDLPIPDEREYRDFKTSGGSYWTQEKVDLDPQKETYGWAYQQLYRHRPERARWLVFSTQKVALDVFETAPSPDGFRLFERQAEAMWQRVVAGEFDGCGACATCRPPAEKAPSNPPTFDWGADA